MYSFPNLGPVCCSMSSSNCCFLTCIQISQETGQVVWYSHLFKNFTQFIVIHTVKGFQFSCSVMSDSLRPHEPQHTRPPCLSPTPGVHPKPMSIESVMPSNHLILCHPLLLLPSIFPRTRVFSNKSALCIRWPKYWSFSFNISPTNEHPGLISFRMDWLDLLVVQAFHI